MGHWDANARLVSGCFGMQDVANALLDAVESPEEDDGDVLELELELEGISPPSSGARKTLEGIRYQVFCTGTPSMRTLCLVSCAVL